MTIAAVLVTYAGQALRHALTTVLLALTPAVIALALGKLPGA